MPYFHIRTLICALLFSVLSPTLAQEVLPDQIDALFLNPSIDSNNALEFKGSKPRELKAFPNSEKLSGILFNHLSSAQGGALNKSAESYQPQSSFVQSSTTGDIQVYVQVSRLDQDILDQLRSLGLEIEVSSKSLKKIQGWIDPEHLQEIAAESYVQRISTPSYSYSKKGAALSQGVNLSKSDAIARLGHTGKGVKVGIVSSGANDWQSARDSGDLPNKVTVYGSCTKRSSDGSTGDLCSLFDSSCNEGTAMAEIIHDIAPDAELAIAAVGTSLEFISQIERLITEFKADIIVDDLGFNFESSFYDDDIALAIAAMPKDVLFVSSAGNGGYGNYRAELRRPSSYSTGGPNPDIGFSHNFAAGTERGGTDTFHGYIIPANSATTVILKWDGRPVSQVNRNTLRLKIFDQFGSLVYASAELITNAGDAIAGLCIPNQTNTEKIYFASVNTTSGPISGQPFQLQFFGRGAIEYPFSPSSIFGHPAVERVLAVGAINVNRIAENTVNFYSSRGPSFIYKVQGQFGLGATSTLDKRRKKPDIVSIDGVNVTGTGGFPSSFFGTSAAAPHVAGIAAQLMSVSNFVKAEDARAALIAGAKDMEQSGFDNLSGYGLANAVAALEALKYGSPLSGILLLLTDDEDESE
jgi:subtilisin family serine protease